MDIIFGLLILIAILTGLAIFVRLALVFVANRHGYTAETMPKHYHIIGVSAYFTAFWILLYVLHITVT